MTRRLSRRRFTLGLGHGLVLGGAATVLGLAGTARAAIEVAAEVSLSRPVTRVGEAVRITMQVKVRGASAPGSIPWPQPVIDSFEIRDMSSVDGSSRNLFAGPAATVHTRRVTAIITPREVGKFDLGFVVDVEGTQVESNVPVLEVLAADAELPELPADRLPTDASQPVFLWATIDKKEVYVGEQLTYQLDVYERRAYGVHLRKPPSFTDFYTEELDEGEPSLQTVGTVDYRVRPGLRRALFPQRAGNLEIGEAELSVGGRQRILSSALQVTVKPLPAEGQPAGFLPSNVGRYTIRAEVDRTEVPANQPVTLTVTISGEGNVKFLDPGPWPEMEGVRRYDPKVETRLRKGSVLGGERRWEFLLIPEHGGNLVIPPHSLAFFDPAAEVYQVVSTEPIALLVEGTEAPPPEPEEQADPVSDEIQDPIVGSTLARHTPRERWLDPTRWAWGMAAVPLIAAGGIGGAALWRRYGADEQAQARARRRRRHRELVEAAEQAVEGGEGFHGAVSTMLRELAVEKAGSEGVGLPRPELLRVLGERGVPAEEVERLRELLDRCDEARFGAQEGTKEDRQALLEDVQELVRSGRLGKGVS